MDWTDTQTDVYIFTRRVSQETGYKIIRVLCYMGAKRIRPEAADGSQGAVWKIQKPMFELRGIGSERVTLPIEIPIPSVPPEEVQ